MRCCLALVLFAAAALASPVMGAQTLQPRTVKFTYRTVVGPVGAGVGPVHVFVPLPPDDEHQTVLSRQVTASIPGEVRSEPKHGNQFWHGHVATASGEPIEVTVVSVVERRPFRREGLERAGRRTFSQKERERNRRFLDADRLVPVDHPMLEPILAEVRRAAGSDEPGRLARAIYDWVATNVEYKKLGTGWGNGDTQWACSARFGNCTDFHSLFNSLARSEGIPSRFDIGFTIPEGQRSGKVGGYHCWAQFLLPGVGWVPVDASEAAKNPARKDELYGGQAADRLLFSVGRDLDLGAGHLSGSLNYFVYPHVEVAGHRYDGQIQNTFTFEEVEPPRRDASAAGPGDPRARDTAGALP